MCSPRRADITVSIALLLLLAAFTIAAVEITDETEARVTCASNLRQIGQALLLYSNDNRGAFPRTVANINDPKPTWGTPYEGNDKLAAEVKGGENPDPFDGKSKFAVAPNDVTAALYLLLRTQDITSEVFVCPSTGQEKWGFGGGTRAPTDWTNWSGNKALAEHLSYSYQNPYPTKEAIGAGFKLNNSISAEFAVAADMNPGVDALTKFSVQNGNAIQLRAANSINHGGDGQNILYGDGHVDFNSSPFVGIDRDNIYTYGDSGMKFPTKGGDGIVGSSVGPNDSILLPTSKDLGNVDAAGKLSDVARKRREDAIAQFHPPTPAQLAATRAKLPGNYSRSQGNRRIKLQITDTRLVATAGPVTIAFDYTIEGAAKETLKLALSAPDTTESATVKFTPDGVLIRGDPYLDGAWKRE